MFILRHNNCLWCVDYNESFSSPLWHWSQSPRSNIGLKSGREKKLEAFNSMTKHLTVRSVKLSNFYLFHPVRVFEVCSIQSLTQGAQWLSDRVLDSRPKRREFEPHRRHCVVVLEQDTFIQA